LLLSGNFPGGKEAEMVDDLRDHDAMPTEEELEWMSAKPWSVVIRALALAGIAIAIGVSVSQLLTNEEAFPPVSIAAKP
jgi:hypothetical protein